jgi:hypothetical protein
VDQASIRFRGDALARSSSIIRSRRSAVSRLGLAVALALCVIGQQARAQDASEPRWIPSLNFGFDTFGYDTTSSVENHINPPEQEDTQTNSQTQLNYQLGGELMGPKIGGLPGNPRLFIQGGVQLQNFQATKIFNVKDAGDPTPGITSYLGRLETDINPRPNGRTCLDFQPPSCEFVDASSFKGQGSRITSGIENPAWYAAIGVAFNLPLTPKLLLQVKPSFAYNVETFEIEGDFTTVTEPAVNIFDITTSAAETTTTDHSIGAGLELALVMFRTFRPVTTSLYVDGRFLWLISDATTTLTDDRNVATYTVTREGFDMRGGAGIRFSWMGSSGR